VQLAALGIVDCLHIEATLRVGEILVGRRVSSGGERERKKQQCPACRSQKHE
jgi:hypothetical protein